jgi:hypothetical protein
VHLVSLKRERFVEQSAPSTFRVDLNLEPQRKNRYDLLREAPTFAFGALHQFAVQVLWHVTYLNQWHAFIMS